MSYTKKRKSLRLKKIRKNIVGGINSKKSKKPKTRLNKTVKKERERQSELVKHIRRIRRANARRANSRSARRDRHIISNWTTHTDMDDDDMCAVCARLFRETPNEAIYISECGHFFHNDCLVNDCEELARNNTPPTCVLCNTNFESECMSVGAFKHKSLRNVDGTMPFDDQAIIDIYENQPHYNHGE
jgi:hypothetical protein